MPKQKIELTQQEEINRQRFKLARLKLGLTQAQVAKKMNVAIYTVRSWEQGQRRVTDERIEGLER